MNENIEVIELNAIYARLESLADLYDRDILSLKLLGRQLLQLISTEEVFNMASTVKEDERKARRLLIRLSDPEKWRNDSSETEIKRKELLYVRLTEVFLLEDDSTRKKLENLVDIAYLPHFTGFLKKRKTESESSRTGGRVKVLD